MLLEQSSTGLVKAEKQMKQSALPPTVMPGVDKDEEHSKLRLGFERRLTLQHLSL